MAKINIFELEYGPDECGRDDTQLILFHSVTPNYAFADDLNKLYSLHLCRIDDMQLFPDLPKWPLFTFYDPYFHLRYYLTERPIGSPNITHWTIGHKLLIIIGDRADDMARTILTDFSTPSNTANPTDLITAQHNRQLDLLRNNFTTLTPIATTPTPPPTLKGKALREYKELHDTIDTLLDYLELNYISDN